MLKDPIILIVLLMIISTAVCNASPKFDLNVTRLFQNPGIRVEATCLEENPPAFVTAELRDIHGMQTLRKDRINFSKDNKTASIIWSDKGLKPDRYLVQLWDQSGLEIDKVLVWNMPGKPSWVGNKIGAYTDSWAPKPWTPLKEESVNPLRISCWGRTYSFNSEGITSVKSNGAEILASPMIWSASVSGKEIAWKQNSTRIVTKADGVIKFRSQQTSGGLSLICNGQIEFDGFVKLTYTLKNAGTPILLDNLHLDIPYRSDCATLTHYFPKVPVWYGGVGIQGINAGYVADKPWSSVFIPHIWLGNEDRGMQWLCESDKAWRPSDESKTLEILPAGNTTTLRLNIIGKQTLIDKPREYTFAFQASPIKPMPADRYNWHYTHLGGCNDIIKKADHMKELGVKIVDTLTWTELWGYPRTATRENVELLQKTIKTVKDRNMKMMLYNAFLMSDVSPEYDTFGKECKIADKHAYVCNGWMNDQVYAVCQKSIWADFMVNSISDTIEKYDLDGLYSDSMSCIGECSNQLHGCGYVAEDGSIHSSVEIFAVRDFMKRIYRVFELREKKTGRPMMFIGHTSANVILPTLSFCTAYLDTEHMTTISRPFKIPLDVFRAEFMGHNFGVPAQTLSYFNFNGGKGLTYQEMLALSLLHDTEMPWDLESMAPIWKIWDKFGMKNTKFMPYWKNWGWNAPENVKVSAYTKPNSSDVLVVAVNVGDQEISGSLALNRNIISASDAFTGKTIPIVDGKLQDTFPFWQLKIYNVKTVAK